MTNRRHANLTARHQHAGAAELQARADRLAAKVAATRSEKRRAEWIEEIRVIGELQDAAVADALADIRNALAA